MAAVIDHRTSRIPNGLTLPFVLLGLALLPPRCAAAMAGLICGVSYAFVYGLWRCGLWGGGDAKLVLGLFILVSPAYPTLLFIAAFSLCLALVLFAKHLL
ncbi:MAG TPA: A24 family peptidase, partial [Methanocella sp.]|nr:A24 family peptidase [Methanocella sp.]